MIMSEVITRLKSQTDRTVLRTLGGALDYAKLKSAPQAPCAFVVPVRESAKDNNVAVGAVRQAVHEQFGVILGLTSRNDRHGDKAEAEIRAVRDAIKAALHGWQPTPDYDPITFVQGDLLDFTNGIVWWQDVYATATQWRAKEA
jgi:hypothetical protein